MCIAPCNLCCTPFHHPDYKLNGSLQIGTRPKVNSMVPLGTQGKRCCHIQVYVMCKGAIHILCHAIFKQPYPPPSPLSHPCHKFAYPSLNNMSQISNPLPPQP